MLNAANGPAGANRPCTRIESDVESLKNLIVVVESTTERIIGHARVLGYFQPPSDAKVSAPTPVVTTLADAVQALARAIDHCSGALNVFD